MFCCSQGLCGQSIVPELKDILPTYVKKTVNYDLARDPSRYIRSTLKRVGKCWGGVCFLPTRRSNIPCHFKVDTETAVQLFHSNLVMTTLRREAGEDRNAFKNCVWC